MDETLRQPHLPFRVTPTANETRVILPPIADWQGPSERLVAKADDPFITRAEASGFSETANLHETMSWLDRLAQNWPELSLQTIGHSAGGRSIRLAVASRFGFTPDAVRASGKAVILVQAGIHSGEIDGKDAMLMILRDLAAGRRGRDLAAGRRGGDLLDQAVILFIPILNVDGYARFGPYNRMNQRGPVEVGWHTNDQNLNLNRDFGKLDAPESRAVIAAINAWQPDLYIDTHVTDGADYQYDVTFGHTGGPHGWSPAISAWIDAHLMPKATQALTREGHVPGPLTLAANDRDLRDGRLDFTANARFTTGWASLCHLPAILVENHSLKGFRQRVLGMYVLLTSLMTGVADNVAGLREAIEADRARRPDIVPLGWTVAGDAPTPAQPFKGIASRLVPSSIAGEEIAEWTGVPDHQPVAVVPMTAPSATARRPKAYYLPAHLCDLAERLRLHGIRVERLETSGTRFLTEIHLPAAEVIGSRPETGIVGATSAQVLEGRVRVSPGEPALKQREMMLTERTYRVDTDQPLGDLAIVLLEPQSPDSFFQWGFILSLFENAAYNEPYVLVPLAADMLKASPTLRQAFEERLASDPAFAASPAARRQWFLNQTPYTDSRYRIYPILRED